MLVACGASARAEDSAPGDWTAPEVEEFTDWSVACDNVRECTAVSLSRGHAARIAAQDPGDYAMPRLWVKRSPGPVAPPRVFVDTTVWGEADDGPGPATLHVYYDCDGDCTGSAYRLLPVEPGRFELAARDVPAFLAESITTSRAATRFADGAMHGIITTGGMTAALRYIDEAQGRRGNVTAIFAKGPRAAHSVPQAPPRPRVRVIGGEYTDRAPDPGTSTALIAARAQLCPAAELTGPDVLRARYALSNGQFLWALGCAGEPDAPRRLWLIETPGQGIAPYLVPRPEQGRPAELPILPNSRFDTQSGQIIAVSAETCGWQRRWAWTGQGFAMIDAIEMPTCSGIPLHQWLQTYRAVPD